MVFDQVRHQRRGLALRPLWQVLTRISGVCLRTIVADWAKGKVCQSPRVERKSSAQGAGTPRKVAGVCTHVARFHGQMSAQTLPTTRSSAT